MMIKLFLLIFSFFLGGGVKMCDKMAISAYILKIVEKDPFLRLQMRAKEMLNRQMEDTPVPISLLWSTDECNIWPRTPGLTSIMAQEITPIVTAVWPPVFIRVQFK